MGFLARPSPNAVSGWTRPVRRSSRSEPGEPCARGTAKPLVIPVHGVRLGRGLSPPDASGSRKKHSISGSIRAYPRPPDELHALVADSWAARVVIAQTRSGT